MDLSADPAHCGSCDVACPQGVACTLGACVAACPSGTTACGGQCVDTSQDAEHCGGCGAACAPGEVCTGGACAVACGSGLVDCGGACVDTSSDPGNCGACGNTCASGESCVSGACVVLCPAGTTSCSGQCTDTSIDSANCGACGQKCPSGQVCSSSACALVCAAGSVECGGACTYLESDAKNCGACGNVCPVGHFCSSGSCIGCSSGMLLCQGICIDVSSSVYNCGACGNVCPGGAGGKPVCKAGVCGIGCYTSSYGDCDATKPGCETYLMSDPKNCGACGVACAADTYCGGGQCWKCPTGKTLCGGECVDLTISTAHCGACGNSCPYGGSGAFPKCYQGVCGFACYSGHLNCDGNWSNGCEVYILSDPKNCGTCGIACQAGQYCSSGECTKCPSGLSSCGNQCVNLATDGANCGGCGVTCSNNLPHAGSECKNGACSLVCSKGWLDCDGNGLSGCETPSGPANCGACGVSCATGQFCSKGACKTCSPTPLAGTTPLSVTGTTIGNLDLFSTSCGYGNAPDVYFSFTAPAAGSYTFDTVGSSFDTVLEIRKDDCEGAKLGCDDNGAGNSLSTLTVQLDANQTVVVVLDGVSNAQGAYKLNVK